MAKASSSRSKKQPKKRVNANFNYKKFAKHIKDLRDSLDAYRVNHNHPEHVLKAYRNICQDAFSDNRLERDLARGIVENFQNFRLKSGPKGRPHTAHSFLLDYELGKIRDPHALHKGMNGVCGDLGRMIVKMYDAEGIASEIEKNFP